MARKGVRKIKTGKQFTLLIGILILAFLMIGALYAITTISVSKHSLDNTTRPTFTTQITQGYPSPTLTLGFTETENFRARQFDPKSFFIDFSTEPVKYPQELININESDLVPLSCTRTYWSTIGQEGRFATYEDGGAKKYSLVDAKLLGYVENLKKRYPSKRLIMINACSTEANKTFVFYGISRGGGGDYWGTPYIGIDSGTGISEVIEGVRLGGCSALQLVKNEFLYIKCTEHEGGGGSDMISQVNLSNRSVNQLLYCVNEGSNVTCSSL